MNIFLKQLFCKHNWVMKGQPFLYNSGHSKMAIARCTKCGKETCYDIFTRFSRKVKVNKNDNI